MSEVAHLLGLDIDGVLHSARDPVHLADISSPRRRPMWQIEVALKTQGRFVWCDYLEQALKYSDVGIVIHSTWRQLFSDVELKSLLPPGLARRVVVLDDRIPGRSQLSPEAYLCAALKLLDPCSVMVLDDRPEMFEQGRVQAWIADNHGELTFVDHGRGISDPLVQQRIASWACTPVGDTQPAVARHDACGCHG